MTNLDTADVTLAKARGASRHLRNLVEHHALTEGDAKRLLDRIDAALNPPPPASTGPILTVIEGGRR